MLALLLFLFAGPDYDLVLQGGHVIDPANHVDGPRDVAVKGGKIAAVRPSIPASQAKRTIRVDGLLVTPGLVDMHTHVFAASMAAEYTGASSVRPDGFTFRNGVTTVVDAGSAGWRNLDEFRAQVINRSKTRVLAMLNIVGKGMGGRLTVEQDVADMDPAPTAAAALRNADVVVGIKVAHYAGPDWGAVDRAVEAGRRARIPVMVDFAEFRPERPFPQLVLEHLRPGDIYTHAYLRLVPMFDGSGRLLPYLKEARRRGVIFDVGHGAGSFYWSQAVPATRQGFWPDSISTDLHIDSMNAGMKDLNNVMSKFLALGMPVEEVIRRVTVNPAREIQRPVLGTLTPGSAADIAVLRVVEGHFGFVDSANTRLAGRRRFLAELTLREGRVVWDLNGLSATAWKPL